MFHPHGPQPPSVYWRRRFVVIATAVLLLLLMVLTVHAMTSGAAGRPNAAGHSPSTHVTRTGHALAPSTRHRSASSSRTSSSTAPARHHHAAKGSHGSGSASASASTSSAPPPACTPTQLAVQAEVGQSTYHVGDKPVVMLQVTNTGATPCVQDLADKQIVLKVYNGESRVWGSHDCEIQPGTDERVLAAGRPVRVSITWSGLTSQPGCHGTRQRVGAGSYTLYAYLAGHEGKAAQFSIV
jgi:hypothetical protein